MSDGADDEDDIRVLDALPPATAAVPTFLVPREGEPAPGERMLAVETPVSITYNGVAHAVMMITPADIEDFVTGFSLTEEIVVQATAIESIDVRALDIGVVAQVRIPADLHGVLMERRRTIVGQTSCGICGIVELNQAIRRYPRIAVPPPLHAAAVVAALDGLPGRQGLSRETGATHAAAFASPSSGLVAVREDVGRHNALDKLIGHLARQDVDPASGFAVMTSRISFELVQKCLSVGIPALVGISAPTALAVDMARRHGLTLIALARRDSFQVFNDPWGLFGAPLPAS